MRSHHPCRQMRPSLPVPQVVVPPRPSSSKLLPGLTKQPPPLPAIQGTHMKPVNTAPVIEEIHEIVFKIALPKTAAAKTAEIPVDTLHRLRDLVSTCPPIQDAHPKMKDSTKLDDIGRQLEDLRACLCAPDMLPPPLQKGTYASILMANPRHEAGSSS